MRRQWRKRGGRGESGQSNAERSMAWAGVQLVVWGGVRQEGKGKRNLWKGSLHEPGLQDEGPGHEQGGAKKRAAENGARGA